MAGWGVPTARRYGTLDEIGAPDFAPASPPAIGSEMPIGLILQNALGRGSGEGGNGLLAAALSAPSGRPGGATPQIAPDAAPAGPIPAGPRVTNGQTAGWEPLTALPGAAASPSPYAPAIDIQRGDGTFPIANLPDIGTLPQKRHGPDWRNIAGIVGDALSGATGQPARYMEWRMTTAKMKQAAEAQRAQLGFDMAKWQAQYGLDRAKFGHEVDKDGRPIIREANGDTVAIAPDGSNVRTLIEGSTDGEDYATSLGLKPGTDEYNGALRDYQLGAHGPTGFSQATALERMRNAVQIGNNIRNNTTSAANNARSTSQSNTNNLRSTSTSATNNQRSTATTAGSFSYQHGSGRQRGRMGAAPVAQDAHGNKITWNGSAWVPAH